MASRREHGLQADRFHAACVVAPHLAQASDARGPATTPQRMPSRESSSYSSVWNSSSYSRVYLYSRAVTVLPRKMGK